MMLTEYIRENSIPTGDEPLGEAWSHPPDEAKAEGLPSSGRGEKKNDVFVWGGEIHGKKTMNNYEKPYDKQRIIVLVWCAVFFSPNAMETTMEKPYEQPVVLGVSNAI